MSVPSINRQLMTWILGGLAIGALVVGVAGYFLTLHEVDEVLDDSLAQTGLLLADRDLATALPSHAEMLRHEELRPVPLQHVQPR